MKNLIVFRTTVRVIALIVLAQISSQSYAGTPKNLEWRGLVNSTWDTTTKTNWFDTVGLTNAFFTNSANVIFDDTGLGNPVLITNVVEPGSVTVSANFTNYTFSGAGNITNLNNPIAGTNLVNLTKNNNSTLTIQTTNGYTGITTLNGGIVSVGLLLNGGSASPLGAASSASTNLVFNGGQLQYTGPNTTFNRGATLNANGGTLAVATANVILTNSGVIAGIGGLTVSSNGTLALSGASTYSGGTTINSGTVLKLIGGILGAGNVTNNGTLLFGANSAVGNSINGPGILTNAPGVTTILSGTNTFAGNVYNGTTNLAASTLIVSNSAALNGTSQVTLSGGLSTSSTLQLAAPPGTGPSLSIPPSVTLVMVADNGSVNRASLSGNVNPCTWNGPITLEGDGSANEIASFVANSASPLTINGNITATLANNFSGQVDFYGAAGGQGVMNGNFLLNTNADFFGPNIVTCTWLINSSGNTCGLVYVVLGTIKLGVNNAMPVNVPYQLGAAGDVGTLDLWGHNQQIAGLTNNASGAGAAIITNSSPTAATLTYSNSLGRYVNFETSGLFTNFSGNIGGKLNLTVAGGILNLSGVSTYLGVTTVSNGAILALTGGGSIAKSANIIVGPNATLSQASSVGNANNPVALGSAQTLIGAGATGTLAGNMYMQAGSSLVLNYNGSTPTLVITNGTFTCTNSGVVTINVPGSLSVGSSFSYLLVSNGVGGTVAGNVPISVAINGISGVAGSLAINGAGLVLTVTNYTPKNLEWRGTVSTNWDAVTTNWFDTDAFAFDFTNFATLDNVTFDDNVGVSNNLVNISGTVQPSAITVLANNTNYTFNGTGGIVGASGLTMSGNSTLTIQNTNSYTGVTALNGGVVNVNNLAIGGAASAIGGAGSASANVVFNGGQLQYTGPSVTIDRGATLGANGGTVAVTTPGSVLTTSGTIAGSNGGGLAVAAGSGVFTLGGINSYNGGTTVNAGGTLGLSGGAFGTGNVTNNGTLLFSGVNTVGNYVTGAGILTNAPGSSLTLSGTNTDTGNIYSGVTNLAVSTLILANNAALAPNTTVTIAGGNSSVLSVGAGVSTLSNVTLVAISGNNNVNRTTLNFLGAGGAWNGTMVLKGDGLPTGDFAQIAAPGGAVGTVNGNTISMSNGPTAFNGQIDIRGVNSQGIVNGNFELGPGVLWAMNDGASWILNSQTNTWGISDIANGTITLGANNALDPNVPLEGNSTGILNLNGNNQLVAGLATAGSGNMLITNNSAVYATLTYSNPANFYQANGFTNFLGVDFATPFYAGTYTNFPGIIAGNMGLTVAAGWLTLTNVNTYTGVTLINGLLALTSSSSIANSTNIIIGTNAIFAPSGQALNGSQTLTASGGAGTIAGNLGLSSGSLVLNNYITNVPALTISNSTLNFTGGNVVTVNVSGSPTLAQASYLLVATTAGGVISGTLPSSVTVNGAANPPGTYGAFLTLIGGQLYLTISQVPVILTQFPVTYTNLFTLYSGASPIFSIPSVSGAPPFSYQWYTNGTLDGATTGNSLQLANVRSSFANDYCIVGNSYGTATSVVWSASVIADPLNSKGAPATYPSNVLSLIPIGYWRLNEMDDGLSDGNPGALTHDYAGGNDALYTNVNLGLPGYNPVQDPSDTSALFGAFAGGPGSANSIQGIDVSATNGANGEFTVEAWVKAAGPETTDTGIVAKGYFGQEEFVLDTGAANSAFRFEVRNAAGTLYNLNSTLANYANGLWYYLVGVCDEANSNAAFYINGVLVTNVSIPAGSGIFNSSSTPMTIGARASSATSGVNNQFSGNINDVSVFNYALSSNQIAAQYQAAGPFAPQIFSQLPITYSNTLNTNFMTLYAGANPAFTLNAFGTPPLSYQWFTNGVLDATATGTNLMMTNVQSSFTNYCIVTNTVSTVTSLVWAASVIADPTNSNGGLAPYPSNVLALNPIGYWRMNDTNLDGPDNQGGDFFYVCHDYAGGNDGFYTNCTLGMTGYNPISDPSDTSAQFGLADDLQNDFGDSLATAIAGINFGAPSGSSVAFTVEAWVQGYEQSSDAGIVTLGWGGGGEQFNLDCGSDGAPTSHGFRFFFRDASGTVHSVTSTVMPSATPLSQGPWYHLAAVVDEITNHSVTLYINSVPVGSAAVAAGSGVLSSSYLMGIGSRQSGQNTSYNDQFVGNINDVVIFNYALSSNQIANEYLASGIAPFITQQPFLANTNVDQNSTLTVTAAANGTGPLSYQWYETNIFGATGFPLAGQTNATFVLSNDLASDSYALYVTNLYGSTNSAVVFVTVVSNLTVSLGPPSLTLYTGQSFTYTAQAIGTVPFYYQWYQGASPIANATNAAYTAVAASGSTSYSCTVSNAYNGYTSTNAGPVTLTGIAAPTHFGPTNLYQVTVLSNNPVAYWRLSEVPDNGSGNAGTIAYDYVGGHNSTYTNTQLGLAGFSTNTTDTAALFGPAANVGASSNSYVGEINNAGNGVAPINFAQPVGSNGEFSVEAWVNESGANGGGIVAKGYGGGGEQFDLDATSGSGFRFFVRDASGNTHGPSLSAVPAVGQWYYVVGVFDGANGVVHLYTNGVDAIDTTGVSAGAGVLTATTTNVLMPQAALVSIGARTSSQATTNYDFQFQGRVDDVALYNYALSPSQIAADYAAAGIPSVINLSPTNIVFVVTNNLLYLSWPANHIGWQLQAQTNSVSVGLNANWANVSGSTSTNTVVVPISLTNGCVFYRLVSP